MKHKGPIITLLAGLLVAGVLFVLNVDLSNDAARNAANRDAAANTTATTTAAPSPGTPAAAAPTTQAPATTGAGKNTYAGTVDGGGAGLAIALSNGRVLAYVCDGRRVEAWLSGTAAGGRLQLSGAKGSLTAAFGNGVATGIVTAGTKQWHFTIKLAAPPSGLYRSAANVRSRLDASWAVVPGPSGQTQQFGLQWQNGNPEPAPSFDTSTNSVDVGGTPVKVDPADRP